MAKEAKRDGRWVANYYDAQGKRHREYRRTKREAQRLLAERLGQIQKSSFRPDVTFPPRTNPKREFVFLGLGPGQYGPKCPLVQSLILSGPCGRKQAD